MPIRIPRSSHGLRQQAPARASPRGRSSRPAETAMGFKFLQTAQQRSCRVNGHELTRSWAPAPRSSTANCKDGPTNRKGA